MWLTAKQARPAGLALALTLLQIGCGGGSAKTCTQACDKLTQCTGQQSCPLSAACTEQEKCLASCIESASCAAITGMDQSAAPAYQQCRSLCGAVVTDGSSPQLDGPPAKADGGVLPDQGASPDSAPQAPDAAAPAPDSAPPAPDQGSPADSVAPGPDQGANVPSFANVTVSKGSFTMGSPVSEACRETSGALETQHQVTLSHSFLLGNREVTQGQFQFYMGYNPAHYAFCGKDCPVEMVTWHEAALYCNAVSKQQGKSLCYQDAGSGSPCAKDADCALESGACVQAKCVHVVPVAAYDGDKIVTCPGFRLPTEAEWELAYRAGTQTAFYNGAITNCTGSDPKAEAIGWYAANSKSVPQLVGQKQANGLKLYDMAGNVMEWVHDGYSKDLGAAVQLDPVSPHATDQRVVRGGAWSRQPADLRAAARRYYNAADRGGNRGFRCARTLP